MTTTTSNIQMARAYARKGIKVFPCRPNKSPRPRNGYKAATTDIKTINNWWKKNPSDLIGAVCDGTFTVLDVDVGGVPDEQRKIIMGIIDELIVDGVIDNETPVAHTKSGGLHFYFQTTEKITRKINYLPAMDILARGGYVIVPDGKVYKNDETVNNLLDTFGELPELDLDVLETYHEKYDDLRKQVKYDIDVAAGKNPKKPRLGVKKKKKEGGKKDLPTDQALYATSEQAEVDPTEELLGEDGTIHIDAFMLDTHEINKLFFNFQIQAKIAEYLGLRVPLTAAGKAGKGTLQRSILVGHADNNPSMGVRWAKGDRHIIARDFSDHYNDEEIDYNVVRLFINRMYGVNLPTRPSKTEWTVWFFRLLYETGIIKLDHIMATCDFERIFGNSKKKIIAAESIFLLDAIKRLHARYSGEFPVSKNFMKAWCRGVHPNTSYQALKGLEEAGVIKHVDTIEDEVTSYRGMYLWTIVEEHNEKAVTKKSKHIKRAMNDPSYRQQIAVGGKVFGGFVGEEIVDLVEMKNPLNYSKKNLDKVVEERRNESTSEVGQVNKLKNAMDNLRKKDMSNLERALLEAPDDDAPINMDLVDWADARGIPWEEIKDRVYQKE